MEENSGRCSSSWVSVNGCVEEICTFPYSYIYKVLLWFWTITCFVFCLQNYHKELPNVKWKVTLVVTSLQVSPDCALSLSSAVPFSCFSSLFGRLQNLGLIKGALWKLVGDLASFFFFFTFYIVYTARSQCHFFLPHQQSMKPTKRLYVYHTLHPTQTAAKLWFTSAFIPEKHHLFNWHSSHFHVISEIQYSYATV